MIVVRRRSNSLICGRRRCDARQRRRAGRRATASAAIRSWPRCASRAGSRSPPHRRPPLAARRSRRRARPRSSAIATAPSAPHALAHAEPQMARDQRHGRRQAQIVAVVLETLAHLEDVAVAFGGEQADLGALALEQRVGRDRRAVNDALRIAPAARRVDAEPARQPRPGPRTRPTRLDPPASSPPSRK